MKKLFLGSLFFCLASGALAEECTHLWSPSIEINPEGPKIFSGDTYAIYGLLGFEHDPHLLLEMTGEFFRGRFMSFESYVTERKRGYKQLYDRDIEPDIGSENPFRLGVALDAPNRRYTVQITPDGEPTTGPNVLRLDPTASIHSLFYRGYVPSHGMKPVLEDLPRIRAFDSRTGEPKACPAFLNTIYKPSSIGKAILMTMPPRRNLEFKLRSLDNGVNHAVPKYVAAVSRVPFDAVSVVRFKAPSFVDTTSGTGGFDDRDKDVRYWSFCIQDFGNSTTLGCVPDYLARIDSAGFATIAIGRGDAVKQAAERRGMTFLPDRRGPRQHVLGYAYRNLFPRSEFPLYEGEWMPVGKICKASEFLRTGCGL